MKPRSIRSKLIVFLLIAIIVPALLTIAISYTYTNRSLKERAIQENQNLIYQGAQNLLNYVKELDRNSLIVYSDAAFYRSLELGPDDLMGQTRWYNTLQTIANSNQDIFQIYLHSADNRAMLLYENIPLNYYDVPLFQDTKAFLDIGPAIEPTHTSHNYGFLEPVLYKAENVFTLHRPIRRIPLNDLLGFLSIDVRLDSLRSISSQLYHAEEEQIFILDQAGYVIYSGNEDLLGRPLNEGWTRSKILQEQTNGSFELNGNVYVFDRIQSEISNWLLVKQIPSSSLFQESNQAAFINIVIFSITLLVVIAATIWVSIQITKPIKQLMRYMNEIQSGNLTVDIQTVSSDEIGVVSTRFKSMMDTINNLYLREYKLQLDNKTNQLKALQAQINPHFMNNTLQSIGTLALQENVPRIYSLISSLAKMMRYSMYNEEQLVTLKDEIDHVKAYLNLMHQRFENQFTMEFTMDEQTLKIPMPKMVLQPIVENYFVHGMDRSAKNGILQISSWWEDENTAAISVKDNGIGVSETKLKELRMKLAEVQTSGAGEPQPDAQERESIGLSNVLSRLRWYNGEQARLEIEALEPHGVGVTLYMKVERENI
ncbi:sensor histidine kinase [Marinicrinis lubricantis]|uniref:Sensor histidine kinase n=1 Tax=Marinicrinis lubricantis TaxID=2086470 RepID=A0ABW1IJX6_9BACL